jgi:hypothetical protein
LNANDHATPMPGGELEPEPAAEAAEVSLPPMDAAGLLHTLATLAVQDDDYFARMRS